MQKKFALVTGAGSGIGRSVAVALAGSGHAVVVAGRRAELLQEVVREGGADMLAVPTDVTDAAAVQRLFTAATARFGRLDVLFNNAGAAAPPTPFEEVTLETWQRLVDTNLTGVFLCAQAAFRIMKAQNPQGGRIINNGSIAAVTPRPHMIAYTATKHAVTGVTKTLALEGRRYNIACGQIDIGNAGTELAAKMASGIIQANGTTLAEPTFDVNRVADAVLHMARLPLDVNVQFMTIMATKMPYIGRG